MAKKSGKEKQLPEHDELLKIIADQNEHKRRLNQSVEQAGEKIMTWFTGELPERMTKATSQYVTLDQITLICGYKNKRTPQRWIEAGEMPPPAIEGGGKAAQWVWAEIRPWLEKKTGKKLRERFPSLT